MVLRGLVLLLFCTALRAEVVRQEKVEQLPFPHQGPFVRAGDGAIWGMDAAGALVSRDEGRSWEPRPIFDLQRFEPSGERALFRSREGVILYAFLNRKELVFRWDDKKGGPQDGCRVPVYLSRSADDGRTWAEPVLLQDGWCGAVRQMIQLRSGRILLVCQKAMAYPGRHVTIVYRSDDLGKSWQPGETIDLGEAGNYRDPVTGLNATTHGGGLEGTVLEKRNGELKLLLRVPHGCFYESSSKDGIKWGTPFPSTLEASDSPGMMTRLASGRVALVWNRFRDPVKRQGRRDQLSIAFSENDGLTWTTPQVIATNPVPAGQRESAYWISYPYVFEAAPGRLWVSTMQGRLSAALNEQDFLAPVANPLDGRRVRIITLGDSITKGARPGVSPTQVFSALLQGALREAGISAQVHNVGIGGERTDQALERLDREVIAQRPHLVTVMYGTNDSWVDRDKTDSRLTERQYEINLREIVRLLQAARIQVVLMTEPRFAEQNPKNGLGEDPNLRLSRYVELCRTVARDNGVPLVDNFAGWTKEQAAGRILQAWTTDGCHPNSDGHADLAARMLPVITPLARALGTVSASGSPPEKTVREKPAGNSFGMRLRPPPASAKAAWAPTIVGEAPTNECSMVSRRDGSLEIYSITKPSSDSVSVIRSLDGGLTWSEPRTAFRLPGRAYYAVMVLEAKEGALHAVYHVLGDGPGGYRGRLYEVWHTQCPPGEAAWSEPKRIVPGYIGSINGFIQLSGSGRLLLAVARAIPERQQPPKEGPDRGWNDTFVYYSDDGGDHWRQSPDQLSLELATSNVTRYGAIEPTLLEMRDGRVWMLVRDRGGRLWQSFSADGGQHWPALERSPFISSDSPADLFRLRNGNILLLTNACQNWSNSKSYAMGGREVLHAAISSDEGSTWRGFREILHETDVANKGDRGSSYASVAQNSDGKIVLVSGQGERNRAIVMFDPGWLEESGITDDLISGPVAWSQYGDEGLRVEKLADGTPAVTIPLKSNGLCGALWNFPMTDDGEIALRVKAPRGATALRFSLNDHFNRIDDASASGNAVFSLPLQSLVGQEGAPWHDVRLAWTGATRSGVMAIEIDGKPMARVAAQRPAQFGVNYLRIEFRATSDDGRISIAGLSSRRNSPE